MRYFKESSAARPMSPSSNRVWGGHPRPSIEKSDSGRHAALKQPSGKEAATDALDG